MATISCINSLIVGNTVSKMSEIELSDMKNVECSSLIYTSINKNGIWTSKALPFNKLDQYYVHISGDENITGIKNFQCITTENVVLSTDDNALNVKSGSINVNSGTHTNIHGTVSADGDIDIDGLSSHGDIVFDNVGDGIKFSTPDHSNEYALRTTGSDVHSSCGIVYSDRTDKIVQGVVLNIQETPGHNISCAYVKIGNSVGNSEQAVSALVAYPLGNYSQTKYTDQIASTKWVSDNFVDNEESTMISAKLFENMAKHVSDNYYDNTEIQNLSTYQDKTYQTKVESNNICTSLSVKANIDFVKYADKVDDVVDRDNQSVTTFITPKSLVETIADYMQKEISAQIDNKINNFTAFNYNGGTYLLSAFKLARFIAVYEGKDQEYAGQFFCFVPKDQDVE